MADNKIKFLRGTSNEYTAAEKDSDTIYFTTDDGKLYIGDKEVSGESIKALNSHINDNVKHITNTERANWNAAKTHADSTHAPSNAQSNVIEIVKVNGTALTPSNKAVNVTVPTKVSELTDSSDYVKTTDSRLSDARTPKAHNQASNTITAMTGYSKSSSTSAITASDSLNTAIGKLEKALDNKQPSGSYAAESHKHDDRYYTESEVDTKLSGKLNTSLKGAAKGLAELDSSGKVPSAQLPSYVDDVLEYTNKASFPTTGESGKIYIAQDTNKTYRWSGSTYIEISPSLALGETSATAYRGDRGKVAYDHSQTAHAPSNAQANMIETIKVNGTALTPSSKAVDITVPTVGNGTITVTQNGSTKGTFTTNQSGNTTIALDDNNTTYSAGTGLSLSGTTFNHKNSITAGTAQGDASKTLTFGGTFTIPTVTYDAQGHITGKGTTTMTMPANPNTDTKVTNTLATTTKAYVTGTTSASTNTGTQVFDTGVYLDTTAGMLTATTFKGTLSGNASTSNKLKSTSYTTISIATSDWSTNSSGGYVCTKTLSSAMAYTNFNFDVVLSTDQSAAKLQIEAWNNIIADGEITQTTSSGSTTAFTFYAFTNKPSVAITVGIQGVS